MRKGALDAHCFAIHTSKSASRRRQLYSVPSPHARPESTQHNTHSSTHTQRRSSFFLFFKFCVVVTHHTFGVCVFSCQWLCWWEKSRSMGMRCCGSINAVYNMKNGDGYIPIFFLWWCGGVRVPRARGAYRPLFFRGHRNKTVERISECDWYFARYTAQRL